MERNIQKIGLVNLAALLVVGGAAELVSRYANSAAGQIGALFLGVGFLVAAVCSFQMRLKKREHLEKMEFDELRKAPAGAALFTQEAETFPARRARAQFERYFIPAFAVVAAVLQGLASVLGWKWLAGATPPQAAQVAITMALWAMFALVFFILGKFTAGIARLENQRLLRPAASYLLLGAFIGFLVAVAEAAVMFDFLQVDLIVARVFCVLLGLVAAEILLNLLLEIYRPRLKGQEVRLLYESRVIGLLGQPGGLITTAAQALDYQFGFKVSQTWLYQFLEKALAWLILLQLSVLFASTTLVIVQPQEQMLLERFGLPVQGREVLEPGLHVKWPWPIDKAYSYSTREIHTFYIGFIPDPELDKDKTIVWTRAHSKEEFNLLVASRERLSADNANGPSADQAVPVNLLSVNIPVQYRIRELRAWAYNHANAAQLLENLANREMVRYLVNVDMDDIMGPGRLKAAEQLRQRLQARADENKLGVEVVFVGLQGIHPPVKVAGAYEEVIGAMQEKETNILAAQAYFNEKIPVASADASNLVNTADSRRVTKVALAAAEASQFTNQITAYQAAPGVFTQRSRLEALVRAIAPARKYIVAATNTQDSIWLNLEDKLRPDLLDIPLSNKK